MFLWQSFRPAPEIIGQTSSFFSVENNQVDLLVDHTYFKDGDLITEHEIFDAINNLIMNTSDLLVIDMFLYNNDAYNGDDSDSIGLAITNSIITAKENNPELVVVFITDPINTFYGSVSNPWIYDLRQAGVEVVVTNLDDLKDSNPIAFYIFRNPYTSYYIRDKNIQSIDCVASYYENDEKQIYEFYHIILKEI